MGIEDRLKNIEDTLSDILEAINSSHKNIASNVKDVMNYAECAEYLGKTKGTITVMVCKRKIPHVKKKGCGVYFLKSEIDKWLMDGSKNVYKNA
jgi:excisionase family DNA binding protein